MYVNYIALVGIFLAIVLFSFALLNIIKVVQFKKHLGVKLNFFLAFFQFVQVNRWLKILNPRYYPSFEAYFITFAKTDLDGYRILNANEFTQNKYGRIIFVGNAISFSEFKRRVDVFLFKPIECILHHKDLKDIPNFFKNYNLPYNDQIQKYTTTPPTKSDFGVYVRLKIMALALAYISAMLENNTPAMNVVLKEVKSTYEKFKSDFTKTEKKLFANKLTEQELMDYSWNGEGLYTLCYVCDVEDKILLPNSPCTLDLYEKLTQIKPDEIKINKEKAIDMINLYYALVWTKREYKLHHKKLNLDEEIIEERYKALVWLFEDDTKYDEVVCDT